MTHLGLDRFTHRTIDPPNQWTTSVRKKRSRSAATVMKLLLSAIPVLPILLGPIYSHFHESGDQPIDCHACGKRGMSRFRPPLVLWITRYAKAKQTRRASFEVPVFLCSRLASTKWFRETLDEPGRSFCDPALAEKRVDRHARCPLEDCCTVSRNHSGCRRVDIWFSDT